LSRFDKSPKASEAEEVNLRALQGLEELDLVLVAPKAIPPVAKALDYGKVATGKQGEKYLDQN
jgi:translation initiation factor IF-3